MSPIICCQKTDEQKLLLSEKTIKEHHCDSCKDLVKQLREEIAHLQSRLDDQKQTSEDVNYFYSETALHLAVYRLPALLVTLVLEMVGGIIINKLSAVIRVYVLMVSFMPVISALSGSLGLQTCSNIIRGLGTGHVNKDTYCKNLSKEILSGLFISTILAFLIAGIGGLWCYLDTDPASKEINQQFPYHPLLFAAVLFIGTWMSMIISTISGAGTPILAHMMQFDPAKVAGPLETAIQDIVGQSFLLGVGLLIFRSLEHLV